LGRTVPELLATTTARELEEWKEFERFEGPLSERYILEMLMQIQEYLQVLVRMTASGNGAKNVPEFRSVDRPFYEPPQETKESPEEKQARDVERFVNSYQRE
jgi:hypothetical protein